jgi:hypothetical protein
MASSEHATLSGNPITISGASAHPPHLKRGRQPHAVRPAPHLTTDPNNSYSPTNPSRTASPSTRRGGHSTLLPIKTKTTREPPKPHLHRRHKEPPSSRQVNIHAEKPHGKRRKKHAAANTSQRPHNILRRRHLFVPRRYQSRQNRRLDPTPRNQLLKKNISKRRRKITPRAFTPAEAPQGVVQLQPRRTSVSQTPQRLTRRRDAKQCVS